jgi:hypothetical protein
MNSRTLAAIVLKGTTTRNGPRNGPGTCRSYNIQPRNELVRNVFPKPYQHGLHSRCWTTREHASSKPASQYSRSVRP